MPPYATIPHLVNLSLQGAPRHPAWDHDLPEWRARGGLVDGRSGGCAPVSQPDARLRLMAFGQQSGPPATAKQVRDLLGLLQDAGHTDFRDARGPMGFTQRQAGGKFTRDEADAFIEQLQDAEHAEQTSGPVPSRPCGAHLDAGISPPSASTR